MMPATDAILRRLERLEANPGLAHRTLFAATSSATASSTAAETSITPAGVGSVNLPADFFAAGRSVRVMAGGSFGYTGTPTIVLRAYFGGSSFGGTGVGTLNGSGSGGTCYWSFTDVMTCRAAGSAGSAAYTARVDYTNAGGAGTPQVMAATATGNLLTTGSMAVDLRVQWGTASSANTLTCTVMTVEVLN